MTQEEKKLLLVDLCARLPYGVICKSKSYRNILFDSTHISLIESEEIKPYLRQMSSMTEDERKEFRATKYEEVIEQYPCSAAPNEIKVLSYTTKTFDWLNEHYFDFRGLIKKGLAIEAPKEMY